MKKIRIVLIAATVLLAVYFMPFITVTASDSFGRVWRVPFGSWFSSAGEDSVTFSNLRSGYAIGRDAANAMHAGEEVKCFGNTYWYLPDSDISLSGYSVSSGIPSAVTYRYQKGNACLGWSRDDEVVWEAGPLAEADLLIDPAAAAEKNWFVIVDGKAMNPGIYNDFSRLVKQGVTSLLRTLIVEGQDRKLVDIQLLETPVSVTAGKNVQEAYYRTAVRSESGTEEHFYTRYSETNETTPRVVSVYEKDGDGVEHETVLFTYSVQ